MAAMSEAPRRTARELDAALSNARQTIALLRSQAESGSIEQAFMIKRLDDIDQLMGELDAALKENVQQGRLAKLYEVSRVIGSSLDLQTVLNQVMDAIIELTGAERGFLMLLDDDGKLNVRVARNFGQETLEENAFALSRTVTDEVLKTGQPIVTTNAQNDPRFAGQQSVISHALRSIMATPLRVRGSVIGVVYVDNRIRTGLFSERDLDVLDTFASQAAVAIDNARLFSATDQALSARVEELTMLQWIDRQLNETLDMAKAMALTLEWSSRVCKARSASMGLLDQEANVVRVVSHYGEPDALTSETTLDLSAPMVKQVIDTQEPLLQKGNLTNTNGANATSVFTVPVRLENKVIGIITMTASDENAFKEDARALVSRMADRAAIAIENARLYDAVRAANNAKSEFVSLVAHELKVPMTSIQGYADLLSMAGPVNEKQTQFVATIKNAVNRMKVLVSDLSDISRIESGHLHVDLKPVSVLEAATSAREGTITEIEKRGHQFEMDIEPNLPLVQADKDRLAQVLLNLLSNAYKYTPDGGRIRLRARREEDRVAISVADSGVGLTPEQIAKLGTKFWRADNGLGQPGTGLGFAITRNLIDLMHGTLEIRSETGKGSIFTVTLPIAG
jgi:signal transduction histidine kinase